MKRTLMQIYAKGSLEAVNLYCRAFDAKLGFHVKNQDGSYYHSEISADGQIIAVEERTEKSEEQVREYPAMQFCFQYDPSE